MANFKTRPRDEQASFLTECVQCRGEISISNGRVDPHICQPITFYATHEDIEDGQQIYRHTMDRLNALFDR